MRTTRGLQITSLIVLSPVLLILLSLLIILVTTLYSQLKIWCAPILLHDNSLSSITSTAISSMTYYNTTSTSTAIYKNTPESKSMADHPTTTTTHQQGNSHQHNNNSHPNNQDPTFSSLKSLKRKSSPLTYFGIILFIGYFYYQKIHLQKCQNDPLKKKKMNQWMMKLIDDINSSGKKVMDSINDFLNKLLSDSDAEETHELYNNENNNLMDHCYSKKTHVQNKLSTNHHRHMVKKSKKHRNKSPVDSKQSHTSIPLLSQQQEKQQESMNNVIKNENKNNVKKVDNDFLMYMDDWINVGEKKKKSMISSPTLMNEKNDTPKTDNDDSTDIKCMNTTESNHVKPSNNNHHSILDNTNINNKNVEVEESDDDDKTIVDDEFVAKDLSLLSTHEKDTNEMESDIGSPNLSSTDTIISTDEHSTFIKKKNQPSSSSNKNWYSPFSTGLTIDVLPENNDPLIKLDPMQWGKYNDNNNDNDHSFTSSLINHFYHHHQQQQQHHHQYNDDHGKFHLLQYHPFVNHSNKLNQRSSSFGVIGQQNKQHNATSSHVQYSSKSNHYSLFI
ncbi:unnamed protein product [Cunninghamella blakesleeana]